MSQPSLGTIYLYSKKMALLSNHLLRNYLGKPSQGHLQRWPLHYFDPEQVCGPTSCVHERDSNQSSSSRIFAVVFLCNGVSDQDIAAAASKKILAFFETHETAVYT